MRVDNDIDGGAAAMSLLGKFPGPGTTGSGVKSRLMKNNEFIRNGIKQASLLPVLFIRARPVARIRPLHHVAHISISRGKSFPLDNNRLALGCDPSALLGRF